MNIILSWWWDTIKNSRLLNIFKDNLSWNRILIIPRAIEGKKYYKYEEWLSEVFPKKEYEIFVLDEWNLANYDRNFFMSFDWMYVWWGNTFKLQNIILEYNFYSVIAYFIENKIFYWSSAGAMIVMRDIETATGEDENLVWIHWNQFLWLDCFNWLNLFCHFDISKINDCKKFTKTHHGKYLGVWEGEWLIKDKDIIHFVWSETIYIFENWAEISCSNKSITLVQLSNLEFPIA